MSKQIILDVKNLNTSFLVEKKEVRIIKDVSFQLEKGKCLAIVGESGCGKSVTIHSVIRLTPRNAKIWAEHVTFRSFKEGREQAYRLDLMKSTGKEIRALRGPEIGMIFQDPMASLNPVYKIGDQISEGLLQHNPRMSKKEAWERSLEMLGKLGIPSPQKRIHDYPHQLSGGMKQRVIIAIAMICNPELLIADEPTTALDVTIQAQIMELMKSLLTEFQKSLILITHNMGLVAEMADEVCVMYMGRIVEHGTLEQIFNSPCHPYTRALLRSVPVMGMEEGGELATIRGNTPNPAELGAGCEFADRCDVGGDHCRRADIPCFEVEPGHQVRCLIFSHFAEVK